MSATRGGSRWRASASATTCLVLLTGAARAEEPDVPRDRVAEAATAAQASFDEARRILAAGDIARACAAFAESQRLEPASGTLLHLADCYERNGQTASAWSTFLEAAKLAGQTGRASWASIAAQRAALLEANVPLVTLHVDAIADVRGLELRRDGILIPAARWDSAMATDPGIHHYEASAPGRRPWARDVVVANAARVDVDVPRLEDAAPERTEPVAPSGIVAPLERQAAPSTPRIVGWSLIAAGGVSLGLGTYFGLRAIAKNDEAARQCPTSPLCDDPSAVARTDEARRAARASTALFLGGGALAVTGLVVLLVAPRPVSGASLRPSVAWGNNAFSLSLHGGF